MPFQEITCAVFSTPTRAMPQLAVPTPISAWAKPMARRLISSSDTLSQVSPDRLVDSSNIRPPPPIAHRP
ncbi:hypothetical protein D9M71_458060 [compost metagenome]